MNNKVDILKKMISDKKRIQEHVQNGGSIEDLDTEEFRFVQPLHLKEISKEEREANRSSAYDYIVK